MVVPMDSVYQDFNVAIRDVKLKFHTQKYIFFCKKEFIIKENKVNQTTEAKLKNPNHQKWLPYQILGGKLLRMSKSNNGDMVHRPKHYVICE